MQTLLTGSAGFLGRELYRPFLDRGHGVVRSDIAPLECDEPFAQADLADYGRVRELMKGVDSVVIAHMAPRNEADPSAVFTATGAGALNVFHAAADAGIKKICLVSSVDVTRGYPEDTRRTRCMSPLGVDIYGLTKSVQEHVAEHYARNAGLSVTALRIGYVISGQTLVNKYGKSEPAFSEDMIDPRDVGEVACRFLEQPSLGFSTYYVLGASRHTRFDTEPTWRALGWKPRYLADLVAAAGPGQRAQPSA